MDQRCNEQSCMCSLFLNWTKTRTGCIRSKHIPVRGVATRILQSMCQHNSMQFRRWRPFVSSGRMDKVQQNAKDTHPVVRKSTHIEVDQRDKICWCGQKHDKLLLRESQERVKLYVHYSNTGWEIWNSWTWHFAQSTLYTHATENSTHKLNIAIGMQQHTCRLVPQLSRGRKGHLRQSSLGCNTQPEAETEANSSSGRKRWHGTGRVVVGLGAEIQYEGRKTSGWMMNELRKKDFFDCSGGYFCLICVSEEWQMMNCSGPLAKGNLGKAMPICQCQCQCQYANIAIPIPMDSNTNAFSLCGGCQNSARYET